MAVLTPSQQARIRQELEEVFVEPGSPLSAFVNDEGFIKAGAPVSAFQNDAGYAVIGSNISQFVNNVGYLTTITRLIMQIDRDDVVAAETYPLAFIPRGDVLVFLDGDLLTPDLYTVSGFTVIFDPDVTGELVIYYGREP